MTDSRAPGPNGEKEAEFLGGGGEMGALMRAHDWRTTPLGAPAFWPQPLKTLVAVMLGSSQPMFVAWGEERILLYNDAYAEILAQKHPALGRPFMLVWAELKDAVTGIVEQAFAGQPVQMDDITLMMNRRGYVEEAHFAFSYTPVRGESGAVEGLFCACTETTRQVEAERRLRDSEARLRGVLEGMAEGFIFIDRDFIVREINDEGMRLEPKAREAILGKTHWEAWPGTEGSELGRIYRQAMETRQPVSMEHRYRWPDGKDAWLDMRAYPVNDGLALFYRDVTERKREEQRARTAAERIELALNSGAILGTWVWDVVEDRIAGDDRFAHTFGLDVEQCRIGLPLGRAIQSIHPEDHGRVNDAIQDSLARGGAYRCEYRVCAADASYRWIEANGRVELGPDGQPVRFPGVLVDIDERRRAEKALRDSEARLRVAQAAGGIGTFELVPETRRILVSGQFCRLWGVPPVEETDVREFLKLIHPKDQEVVSTGQQVLPDHALDPVEYRIIRPDTGETRWLARRGEAVRTESGEVRWLGVVYDITARKATEEALREREGQLSAFIDQTMAGFAQVDLNGLFTLVNDRFCEIAGRSREELLTLTMQQITHPDDLVGNIPKFQRAVSEGTPFVHEKRYVRPDGSIIWVNNSVSVVRRPSGDPYGVLAVSVDVTERRRAEATVRENEARLRALTDNLPAGMVYQVSTGKQGEERRFVYVSQSSEKLTGHSADAILADASVAYEMIEPDDRPRMVEAEEQSIKSRAPFDVQVRFRRKDGELRWGRIISAPREGADGAVIWDGIKIDITDEKKAEDLLRDLNATLEQRVAERTAERDRAWRNTQDILITVDAEGRLHAVNPAWCRVLGHCDENSVGRNIFDFIHPGDQARTVDVLAHATRNAVARVENRYRHADGSYRWISWMAAPEADFVYASGRDITPEKQAAEELALAQEALRQSQKMEAMGQLTGGVAHDFNNLLTPIIGSLDLLHRKALGGAREQRLVEGALQSAERARTLVQRLLAFARRQPLQTGAVNVTELVCGMVDLVDSTTGPHIKVETRIEEELPFARADANQLEMAVLNLAVNARDAMPEGGTITISARTEAIAGGHASRLPQGDYVRLAVADTGVGMDEETLARAIEPFFSTKGLGRGTGLGLSMVHGLAAQLGGALTMTSRVGEGTCAELWLPLSHGTPAAALVPRSESQAPASAGTVLLVDDEPLVRASTADMLTDLGFTVVEAETAQQALGRMEGVDLVITDHLMPGLTGTELAAELGRTAPGVPVLLISGYAELEGLPADLPRLTKPFRQDELAQSIAALRR